MRGIRELILLTVLIGWGLNSPAGYASEDEWQGMPEGEGREETFYACQSCHSIMLVTQQGLNENDWTETIEWMIEEQGMAELDEEEAPLIIKYLTKFYGQDRLAKKIASEN